MNYRDVEMGLSADSHQVSYLTDILRVNSDKINECRNRKTVCLLVHICNILRYLMIFTGKQKIKVLQF